MRAKAIFALPLLSSVTVIGLVCQALGAQGWTNPGNIDHTHITQKVPGDIGVQGKIDGGSVVRLISTDGSITIDGKIDGGSSVNLHAARDIRIGVIGGEGDKKIDGNSIVVAFSGGRISLGGKIDGGSVSAGSIGHSMTSVTFNAKKGIEIGGKIDGGSQVNLCTASGKIHIHDKIDNSATKVLFWPSGSLIVDGGIQRGTVSADQKACSAS